MSQWTFDRGDGAPAAGVWFRIATNGAGFGPWAWAGDFDHDSLYIMFEWGLDANDMSDEVALLMNDSLVLWGGLDEDVWRCCAEMVWGGRAIITSDAIFNPDVEEPRCSPVSSEIDYEAVREVSQLWMDALRITPRA